MPIYGSLKHKRGVGDLRDARPKGHLTGDKKRAANNLDGL